MKGLAQRSPFPPRPLAWASPPPGGAGHPSSVIAPPGGALSEAESGAVINQAMTSVSFAFSYDDNSINKPFPSAQRVARLPFITPVGIISVTLATSMSNGGTGVLAVFVAKDVGVTISASQNGNIYVEHVVVAGLGHSMRSGMAFSDDIAPKFGSNEAMAVYISDNSSGGNLAAGVVTIRYFQNT